MRGHTGRHLASLLLAGATGVAVGAPAHGALTIDLVPVGTTNGLILSYGKFVRMFGLGTVTFEVYANLPNADGNSANDSVGIVQGSFLSTREDFCILGDLSATLDPAFAGVNSSLGAQQDLDSDSDLDVGSNNNSTSTNFFVARSVVSPFLNSTHAKLGTITLNVSYIFNYPGAISGTYVNFRPRSTSTGFLWREDGITYLNTNRVNVGESVFVFYGYEPEPSGAAGALLALGTWLATSRSHPIRRTSRE